MMNGLISLHRQRPHQQSMLVRGLDTVKTCELMLYSAQILRLYCSIILYEFIALLSECKVVPPAYI